MNPPPNCPHCNSNTQVWVNQLSGKLTCHRIGCHVEIPKPIINPEYLRAYGWRFIPSHDKYISGQLLACPECWQHDDWGEAATAEEADAITQANCCRVRPYDPIHVGPPPLSPAQESFNEGLIKLGDEKQGIRHKPFEEPFITLPYKVTIATESTGDVQVPTYKRKKPSLLARLFSRVGQKRRGWSGPRED